MRSIFSLTSFITRIPAAIADKLHPAASRQSELSMKLAGAGGTSVRLTAWKPVDSDARRWNDPLSYSHYQLPRLELKRVAVENLPQQRFGEYFMPQQYRHNPVNTKMLITRVKERAI